VSNGLLEIIWQTKNLHTLQRIRDFMTMRYINPRFIIIIIINLYFQCLLICLSVGRITQNIKRGFHDNCGTGTLWTWRVDYILV